jgi:UDP-2,4-diacetamido-2,4,6-trideoxy-beta-L-gulopyranose hydrolase
LYSPREVLVCLQAGGRGSRLRPLTDSTPKPLLLVGGMTILERLFRGLYASGFRRFIVVSGWQADRVEGRALRIGALHLDASIEFVREKESLGNAGALALLPQETPTLLAFADLVTDMDFGQFCLSHTTMGVEATVATHTQKYELEYGEIVAAGGRVLRYEEKPMKSFLVCSGFYLFEPAALRVASALPSPFGVSDLIAEILNSGLSVAHWTHQATWIDVNSTAGLSAAETVHTTCGVRI